MVLLGWFLKSGDLGDTRILKSAMQSSHSRIQAWLKQNWEAGDSLKITTDVSINVWKNRRNVWNEQGEKKKFCRIGDWFGFRKKYYWKDNIALLQIQKIMKGPLLFKEGSPRSIAQYTTETVYKLLKWFTFQIIYHGYFLLVLTEKINIMFLDLLMLEDLNFKLECLANGFSSK